MLREVGEIIPVAGHRKGVGPHEGAIGQLPPHDDVTAYGNALTRNHGLHRVRLFAEPQIVDSIDGREIGVNGSRYGQPSQQGGHFRVPCEPVEMNQRVLEKIGGAPYRRTARQDLGGANGEE